MKLADVRYEWSIIVFKRHAEIHTIFWTDGALPEIGQGQTTVGKTKKTENTLAMELKYFLVEMVVTRSTAAEKQVKIVKVLNSIISISKTCTHVQLLLCWWRSWPKHLFWPTNALMSPLYLRWTKWRRDWYCTLSTVAVSILFPMSGEHSFCHSQGMPSPSLRPWLLCGPCSTFTPSFAGILWQCILIINTVEAILNISNPSGKYVCRWARVYGRGVEEVKLHALSTREDKQM